MDKRDWAALDTLGPVLPIAERMLRETSAPGAPWTIVESTDERYRDLTVARTILAAITARMAEPTAVHPIRCRIGVRRVRRRGQRAFRR